MTEQEQKAIKWMKNVRDDAVVTLDHIAKEEPNVSPMLYAGRKEKAETIIKGFEELEQYRAIGTVEEFRKCMDILNKSEVNELSRIIDEWILYHKIGTPEECRAAVEKQTAKKLIRNDKCTCPSCGTHNEVFKKRRNTVAHDIVYCWHCGQAVEIDRLEE